MRRELGWVTLDGSTGARRRRTKASDAGLSGVGSLPPTGLFDDPPDDHGDVIVGRAGNIVGAGAERDPVAFLEPPPLHERPQTAHQCVDYGWRQTPAGEHAVLDIDQLHQP